MRISCHRKLFSRTTPTTHTHPNLSLYKLKSRSAGTSGILRKTDRSDSKARPSRRYEESKGRGWSIRRIGRAGGRLERLQLKRRRPRPQEPLEHNSRATRSWAINRDSEAPRPLFDARRTRAPGIARGPPGVDRPGRPVGPRGDAAVQLDLSLRPARWSDEVSGCNRRLTVNDERRGVSKFGFNRDLLRERLVLHRSALQESLNIFLS